MKVKYYECFNGSRTFYYKEYSNGELMVSANSGWMRAFYTTIKAAEGAGIIINEISKKRLLLSCIDA